MSSLPSPTQAALQLCAPQDFPPALYMLATPIGNLADISLRALAALHHADRIAAEDTRVAQRLLDAYGLRKPALRCDRHREAHAAQHIVAAVAAGERVAFVSDAGTPGISDPGSRIAAAVHAAGLRVLPIPGASAVTAALSASGLDLHAGYCFAGFAPDKPAALHAFLQAALQQSRVTVFFEAPHRILHCVQALCALDAQARLVLAKELSKQFETVLPGSAQQVLDWLQADPRRQQGEFVLLLQPRPQAALLDAAAQQMLQRLAQELPAARAAAVAADLTGVRRDVLYRWLLDHKTVRG
ncbi:16S rRNA (cytidine(1402)-2'-O)-methyltransferase [Thiomonas sp.]|uniref:16S rRNA (cytidine(1402)-2'-O)-methyltransferase n=1 Tax=Thiomonas sp. TaxID=2047785 RepID=UPI0026050051|nr:16S rRNA (cytidine(1402)-2'-O)-methyltransferase [Thiomonas sp.]